MLVELRVANLGLIDEATIIPGSGMTAVTGETGAGKTLVVTAISLLTGGRADTSLVAPGASEAVVDGRFVVDGEELVLSRVVPAQGRSRAYRNGRPISAAELAELAADLVEIHGQHAHQQLTSPAAQRRALDQFGGIDTRALRAAAAAVGDLLARRDALGGDERERARRADVMAFQLRELEEASLDDPDEDERLQAVEGELGNADALRGAVRAALGDLAAERGARDRLASAAAGLRNDSDGGVFDGLVDRLGATVAEVDDLVGELRALDERLVDDPERLAAVQQRRRQLTGIRRKYGPTLAAAIAERESLRGQLEELHDHEGLLERIEAELTVAMATWEAEASVVAEARRAAAPRLAAAVEAHLGALGMAGARFLVTVDADGRLDDPAPQTAPATGGVVPPDAGDRVTFLLGANRGVPPAPVARAASGGELARTMLALRLVLSGGPPTAVFDEVDAGIGGDAANRVGDALAEVACRRQVLVVTHLAQVAARASTHIVVAKHATDDRTTTTVGVLQDAGDRRTEMARLLSGDPDSSVARQHAAELLDRHGG